MIFVSPRVSRWDLVYVILFGVLLIPVDYYYLVLHTDGVSISVIVYPVAMLFLMLVAVVDRERDPRALAGGGTVAAAHREPDSGAGA